MGGISSSSSSSSSSGGLVGSGASSASGTSMTITNSYVSGMGGISSSSSSSSSGGLVGSSSTATITNSYWNTDASQSVNGMLRNQMAIGDSATNPAGATGLTLMQLKATSISTTNAPSPSGLPTQAWDLGTASQLPAIKICIPTVANGVTNWTMCASYGALLAGQR